MTRRLCVLCLLTVLLLGMSTAAGAQEPTRRDEERERAKGSSEQDPQEKQSEDGEEQRQSVPPPDVVVPPEILIFKKSADSISIPDELSSSSSTYESKPAASGSARIGSQYGYRRDPFTRRSRFHSGIDIKAAQGDPVGASHAGTVTFAGWLSGYGNLVIVGHGGGVTTYYAHLSDFEVGPGDMVERGVVVGYAGRTGRATSPHLHYEVRINGQHVNPLQPVALDPDSGFFKDEEPQSIDQDLENVTRPRRADAADKVDN